MDNPKAPVTSRLKPPSNLPKPTTFKRVLQPVQTEKRLRVPGGSSMRRSRSCTDLRTGPKRLDLSTFKKPLNVGITTLTKDSATSASTTNLHKKMGFKTTTTAAKFTKQPIATGLKRAATTLAPVEGAATKPKVSKPTKPAPYDYKARFNLLNEKHKNLVEVHKEVRQKLENSEKNLEAFEDLQKNYTSLLDEKDKLMQTHDKTLEELADLQTQLKQLVEKHGTLTDEHQKLQDNHESLHCKHIKLIEDHKSAQQTNDGLKSNLNDANNKINSLQLELQEYRGSLQSYQMERRLMHNKIQDLKGTIRVFCRVRPHKPDENDRMLCNISFVDECTLEIKKTKESISQISGKVNDFKQEFNFDKVFPPEATQAEVFEELSYLVQSALDGYHVCVFAYGQTGSGKTYTMQGNDTSKEYSGMIPRTIDLIFDLISNLSKFGWVYTVEASFLEIYNENIKDLLDRNNKEQLDILFNEGKGTTVRNLSTREVESAIQLKELMVLANRNRAVATTNFNEHSSRSHAVTKITLKGENQEMQLSYVGSLNLVDLAGSESAKTSSSERMPETKNINKSLSILGMVMFALHNKENHIPYRNSKLTYLLQSSLGGNSKTLMFVNVSPFEECYNENVNSLRFASKVKEVRIMSKRNKTYLQRENSNI